MFYRANALNKISRLPILFKTLGFIMLSVSIGIAIAQHNFTFLVVNLQILLPIYMFIVLISKREIHIFIRFTSGICVNFFTTLMVVTLRERVYTSPPIQPNTFFYIWEFEFFLLALIAILALIKITILVERKENHFGFSFSILLVIFSLSLITTLSAFFPVDFYWKITGFKTIIHLVENGDFKNGNFRLVDSQIFLPPDYEYLGLSGRAHIEDEANIAISFSYNYYTPARYSEGTAGPVEYYLYSSTGIPPKMERMYSCKIVPLQKFWFRCFYYG